MGMVEDGVVEDDRDGGYATETVERYVSSLVNHYAPDN
jgi:hypothetical protein